jgi:hypothetical protein
VRRADAAETTPSRELVQRINHNISWLHHSGLSE